MPSDLPAAARLSRLPAAQAALLSTLAAHAQAHGATLWLIGGLVRDLLSGGPPGPDIDLALEGGSVPALVATLATTLGAQVVAQHAAFGTATLHIAWPPEQPQCQVVDLAQTRHEHYAQPAVLPQVAPADIATDLARRDFSVNALALRLWPPTQATHAPVLLDPFDGRGDLARGVLRVLHPASFRDDPTRMLRGVRLAARLGLAFAPDTHALLKAALAAGYLAQATPDRIRTELCLALAEPNPLAVWWLAEQLGLLGPLFAPLPAPPALPALPPAPLPAEPLVRAGILTYSLDEAARAQLRQHYRLPSSVARLLHEVGTLQAQVPALAAPGLPASKQEMLLQPYSEPALHVVGYVAGEPVRARCAHYLASLRPLPPLLDGHDLQRLGVPRGPRLGTLLAALRAAQLDMPLTTRAEAEQWVRAHQDTRTDRR